MSENPYRSPETPPPLGGSSSDPIGSYRERVIGLSCRRFTLYPDHVLIEGVVGSSEFRTPVAFETIRLETALLRTPNTRLARIVSFLTLLVTVLGFVICLRLPSGNPTVYQMGWIVFIVTVGAISIALVIVNRRRIEYCQFISNAGTVAFDIARSGPDRDQFDAFVEEIKSRVRASRSADVN